MVAATLLSPRCSNPTPPTNVLVTALSFLGDPLASRPAIRAAVFLLPIPYCLLNLALFHAEEEWYRANVGGEDRFLENVQFVAFAVAGVLCFVTARRVGHGRQRLGAASLYAFALVFVFVAMEEISWGQRVFGIETPSFLRNLNVQGETNLHNLKSVQYKLGIMLAVFANTAARAWLVTPKALLAARGGLLRILVPRPICTLYFLIPGIYALGLLVQKGLGLPAIFKVTQQEPFETLLAIGCVVYVFAVPTPRIDQRTAA